MSPPKLKLKCPNCNQTEKGFRLYASTGFISACNGYVSVEDKEVAIAVECLNSLDGEGGGCGFIGPREGFEDAATDANNENAKRPGDAEEGETDGQG